MPSVHFIDQLEKFFDLTRKFKMSRKFTIAFGSYFIYYNIIVNIFYDDLSQNLETTQRAVA